MITIRWGVIAATGAFIISLCLGMLAGNQALRTIVTAFVFGFIFFGLGFGLRVLINNFFPEVIFADNQPEPEDSYEDAVQQVNITLENTGEYAVPEMHRIPGQEPELGNIEDLISGSYTSRKERVDFMPEEEYNKSESVFMETEEEAFAPQPQEFTQGFTPGFTPSFGDGEGLGGLPDLDAMAMAFSSNPGEVPKAPAEAVGSDDFFFSASEPVSANQDAFGPDRSQYKGNKAQSLEGDFDPKEIAQGIRTVLSKDK